MQKSTEPRKKKEAPRKSNSVDKTKYPLSTHTKISQKQQDLTPKKRYNGKPATKHYHFSLQQNTIASIPFLPSLRRRRRRSSEIISKIDHDSTNLHIHHTHPPFYSSPLISLSRARRPSQNERNTYLPTTSPPPQIL